MQLGEPNTSYMNRLDIPADIRATLLSSGLFDGEWYTKQYPDVSASGLDPLEHFLRFGLELGRDPGPQHSERFLSVASGTGGQGRTALLDRLYARPLTPRANRALHAAAVLSDEGRYHDALRLGRGALDARMKAGLSVLKANRALKDGDRDAWLQALNGYLADFGMAPIALGPGLTLLSRLQTPALPPVDEPVKITVIMPVWNGAETVEAAANSILRQSWRNLELIIVDDASTDDTWSRLRRLAAHDQRVRLLRNQMNVGPYVSKNVALKFAEGDWITGHDADDWAHPQRLERQVRAMQANGGTIKAGAGLMIRMSPAGHFGLIGPLGPASPDGVLRNALISTMFERRFLIEELGGWDSVRYGADAEISHRAKRALGDGYRDMSIFTMLCLDHGSSLTGARTEGRLAPEMSPSRSEYLQSFHAWHARIDENGQSHHLAFPLTDRPFEAPAEMIVPARDAKINMESAIVARGEAADTTVHAVPGQDVGPEELENAERILLEENRLARDLAVERARANELLKEVEHLTARILASEGEHDAAVAGSDQVERLKGMLVAARAALEEARNANLDQEAALGRHKADQARMNLELARLTHLFIDNQASSEMAVAAAQKRTDALDRRVVEVKQALKLERRASEMSRERIALLEIRVSEASVALKASRRQISGIKRSLSWRLTRPLRALRRLMART